MIARLRAARRSKGWSQKDLAERLGKPQSYISKYEIGERRLDFVETVRIARLLSIKLASLVPPELR
jgi:transcriptional regulator with XRE-family HTH domain